MKQRTSENVLLDTALQNFYGAAEELGLDDGLIEILGNSERRVSVSIPVTMDDGTVKVFNGYRVQHSTALGPAKGGIRFHPDVTQEECEALAMLMTWKCSLAGIPYGGGKGGVECNPLDMSKGEKERVARTLAARLEPFIGSWTDVPAPDVNTGGQEMVWFMDTISKMRGHLEPGVFTGKPVTLWGSQGRTEATGLGVATCALELLKVLGENVEETTVTIQGFGNVGTFAALTLQEAGAKVIAISDILLLPGGEIATGTDVSFPDLGPDAESFKDPPTDGEFQRIVPEKTEMARSAPGRYPRIHNFQKTCFSRCGEPVKVGRFRLFEFRQPVGARQPAKPVHDKKNHFRLVFHRKRLEHFQPRSGHWRTPPGEVHGVGIPSF